MNTLTAPRSTVKPAARVWFDSVSFTSHAPDFGTFASPDRPTVDDIIAYWDGVAAKKKAEHAAREDVEEEARLLANCPPEVHEEMTCEWARPFEA
jgi:hypothetical protein